MLFSSKLLRVDGLDTTVAGGGGALLVVAPEMGTLPAMTWVEGTVGEVDDVGAAVEEVVPIAPAPM